MKQMIKISTKTGDAGTSGLANGERLGKHEPIFAVIGDVDELNSWIGLVIAKLNTEFTQNKEQLLEIQDTLFYIGAELARSPKAKLTEAKLKKLEQWGDELQESMAEGWHSKFLLPGGTELGAHLDITRTVCRRCERSVVEYAQETEVSPLIIKYLNRLSDYLYLVRCFVNESVKYVERQFEYGETVKPRMK